MSPQQAQGDRPTPRDDLYALGATLYELMTSEPPFGFQPPYQALLTQTPASIRDRRRQLGQADVPIPDEWEKTIAALLSKAAEQRPQSAREVLKAFGLESSGLAKSEDGDEEAFVLTQTAPRSRNPVSREVSNSPKVEEEDGEALTVVPQSSRAAKDPALAEEIPVIHPSGSFTADGSPEHSSGVEAPAATETNQEGGPERGQNKLVVVLSLLLLAAVAVIVFVSLKR
jgi:serine/threonine protein kinase